MPVKYMFMQYFKETIPLRPVIKQIINWCFVLKGK